MDAITHELAAANWLLVCVWGVYSLFLVFVRRRLSEPVSSVAFLVFNVLVFLSLIAAQTGANSVVACVVACVAMISIELVLVSRAAALKLPAIAALAFPIACLCFARSQPLLAFSGVGYLCFRLSRSAFEVLYERAERPHPVEFFNYALYAPTLTMGPISGLSTSRSRVEPSAARVNECCVRIAVGMVKFLCLGPLVGRWSFESMVFDGMTHGLGAVFAASACFYLALYLKFSGFCDVMISLSAIARIEIDENFNHPLLATDIADFWRRWHMTLLDFLRKLVFTPVATALARRMGSGRGRAATTLAILATFLVVGLWHGSGWNFLAFAFYHGVAVAVVTSRRRRLAKRGQLALASVRALTFVYVSFGFVFFANDGSRLVRLFTEILDLRKIF